MCSLARATRFLRRTGNFSVVENAARLANYVQDVPERYVPALMRGELVEAEHLCRYLWASAVVKTRRVLDAGCGMAYGTALLARAGASSVVGLDIAPAILEAARPGMPPAVELAQADVRAIPFGEAEFDVVVCFEVIEQVDDPGGVLDELTRVMAQGGVLLVSCTNREVYPSGNPHHVHEFVPSELESALRHRFEHVQLVVQHPWTASLITNDPSVGEDARAREHCNVYQTSGIDFGSETYSLAIASNDALPTMDDVAVLAGDLEFRRWLELFDQQRERIDELEFGLAEARSVAGERVEMRRELLAAEQLLAELPELRARGLARQIDTLMEDLARARDEADRGRSVVEDMKSSLSWRITAPLRSTKRLAAQRRR